MKAREKFEKLGFNNRFENTYSIKFYWENPVMNWKETITFNGHTKKVTIDSTEIIEWSKELNDAIETQMKELGWI
jgi:hypothetical protein